MQMLPAIMPNAPSATVRPGKASEPVTEGVFQSVLNQESGQTVKTEAKLSTKQSEGKTAKHKATDSSPSDGQQSDTTSEEIVTQEAQALLAVAQSLIPPVSSQIQQLEEQTVSEQAVAPAMEIVPAQSALQMPTGASQTDDPSGKSIANQAGQPLSTENQPLSTEHQPLSTEHQPLSTEHQPLSTEYQPLSTEHQPIAETLQSGKEAIEGAAIPMSHAVVESQPFEISKTVVRQMATPPLTSANPAADKHVAAGLTAHLANGVRTQHEQTSSAASRMAVSDAGQPNNSAQQLAATQNIPASAVPNGPPTGLNTARKAKPEALGDSRFSQLLGRQDTAITGTLTVNNTVTVATGFESPGLELPGITGLNLAGAATNSQPAGENRPYPEFEKGAMALKDGAIQPEKVTSPAPGIAAFVGEDANSTQTAELATQPVFANIDTPVSGNNETATGLPEGSVQPALAGPASAPVFSPAQTPATHTATMQQNTGFPIPEQEVMEQVIRRSSLRELEGKREITVELHPEDLGQVKLNLVQEKDRLQLHLQAQSSEVRDILEKHLPRLQEAMQQQGLRLETIQVSVDAQRNNAQGFFERQQQQQAQRNPWQHTNRSSLRSEEQRLPVQAAISSSANGLSLRI